MLDVPDKKLNEFWDMLVILRVTKGEDFAHLDDSDVVSLIKIIPKIKRHNLLKLLAEFCQVLTFLSITTSLKPYFLSVIRDAIAMLNLS